MWAGACAAFGFLVRSYSLDRRYSSREVSDVTEIPRLSSVNAGDANILAERPRRWWSRAQQLPEARPKLLSARRAAGRAGITRSAGVTGCTCGSGRPWFVAGANLNTRRITQSVRRHTLRLALEPHSIAPIARENCRLPLISARFALRCRDFRHVRGPALERRSARVMQYRMSRQRGLEARTCGYFDGPCSCPSHCWCRP